MNMTIARAIAVRKGYNFQVVRGDGWYEAGDVLHVVALVERSAGSVATLTLIRDGLIIGESAFTENSITANVITGKWAVCDRPFHYLAGQDELRVIYESTGDFNDAPICGNGAPPSHINGTKIRSSVTCAHCIKKLARHDVRK